MMKTISIITAVVTGLLLLSTLICGLWIKSQNMINNAESLAFHTKIGIASVVFGLITVILLIAQVSKR